MLLCAIIPVKQAHYIVNTNHHLAPSHFIWINPHDRVILTICEHIGAAEAVGVGGGEGIRVDEPAVGKVIVAALEVVKARFAVVVIAAVTQGTDVPNEGGIRSLFAVSTMHGIVAPRAVGAAAQRDTADNDDDLWLCADGCTHHSDHLSISQRAMLLHRPRCSIVLFYEYADGIVLLEFCKLFFLPYQ